MEGRQSNFAYFALNSSPPKPEADISLAAPTTVFSLKEAQGMHIIP
jgi:hypothetical protein